LLRFARNDKEKTKVTAKNEWIPACAGMTSLCANGKVMVSFYLQSPGRGEGAEAAVEGFLDVVGEAAAGQFLY